MKKTAPLQTLKNGDWIPGLKPDMEYLPNTNDWHGRHRLVARRENDYFIDREMQKHENYTGIQGIGRQDQADVECMGEIVDRSLEHLAPSDRMIAITRKRLLEACQKLMKDRHGAAAGRRPGHLPRRPRRRVRRPGEAWTGSTPTPRSCRRR